jgi:phosphoenolpyruvate carboxylase
MREGLSFDGKSPRFKSKRGTASQSDATAAGQPVQAELDRAITATTSGISAGLRNTG